MVRVAERAGEAAWRIRQREDYEQRLEAAVRRISGEMDERPTVSMAIYEVVLGSGGRPREEVMDLVRRFREVHEDEEEPLIITRTSGIMNVGDDSWFFGERDLRLMTGRLLGQFQHRVAQYNYVYEDEVARRWANAYDTRLFIRRRIPETEPVAGVIPGVDLALLQGLRVALGGNTLVPTPEVRAALESLGYEEGADDYEVLARAETVALHLELPAPLAGALLEGLARDSVTDYPDPPPPGGDEEAAEDAGHPEPGAAKEDGPGTGSG